MAEAEITVREDVDDLLREIFQPSGIVATLMNSQKVPWLRARGTEDSVLARTRYPFKDSSLFDNCQNCGRSLSGCIEGTRASSSDVGKWTLVLSCGHVLCEQCKEKCARTEQERMFDPPLFQCPICAEFGSANKLPGPASVNLVSCQTSYCSGEEFAPAPDRCDQCAQNICTECVQTHAERFPDHHLTPRDSSITVAPRRAFTGCATHKEPVTSRCDCGEMVCDRCPYNYVSRIPGTARVQNHGKTRMEEVDLTLEDALADTIGTISRIRSMRSLATQKKAEVEEVTDNLANEVALHFNQIILQAVQRCFDVLKGVKQLGAAHYSAIDNHIKMLDKTERQLTVGVEIDERARSRDSVKAESVAQYVRNVAYGLCKPAMEQFEDSKEFSAQLAATPFDVAIREPATGDIVDSIGRWGEAVYTNGDDVSKPMTQARIPASTPVNAASMVNGDDLGSAFLSGRSIMATEVPLRLHSALHHFTDLYERCFVSPSLVMEGQVPEGHKLELPFQVGLRDAREGAITAEEMEARDAYERYMRTRPGMKICQPKIFGGFRRIYNLVDRPSLTQKDVQMTYSISPCLAPIWMPDSAKVPEDVQAIRQQQRPTVSAASAADSSSRSPSIAHEARPTSSAEIAADSDTDEVIVLSPSPPAAACRAQPLQQLQPEHTTPAEGQKVVRKSKFVFFKKVAAAAVESPPVLQPEVMPTPRPAYGTPAPSRLLGPSILRRPAAPSQQQQPTYFRPASAAERAAVAAATAAPMPARQLLRIVPPLNDGRPRYFKGPDGTMRMVRNGQFGSRPFPRLVTGALSNTRMEAGRDSDRLVQREDIGDGQSVRVNTMRMMGTPEHRYSIGDISKDRLLLPSEKARARVLQDTPEEKEKRRELVRKGLRETEINAHLDRVRNDKLHVPTTTSSLSLSGMRVVVPTNRNGVASVSSSHTFNPSRFSMGGAGEANGGQPVLKKRMLPIERAFTNMFGADGSNIPEFARRRGRPTKDDPTAPSNIIERFKKHQTQWPPKFDEMEPAEVAELQDLIDQLDAATREEEEASYSQWDNPYGMRTEGDDSITSPWQSYTMEERDQIKAAAREKIHVAKTAGRGCFVCALFRNHSDKPRTWQCTECHNRGRALTPIGDDEIIPADPITETPPPAKKARKEAPSSLAEDETEEEEDEMREEEEEVHPVDLSAIFAHVKKVETRGRPRKNKAPEEAAAAPTPKQQQRTSREPKKRREPTTGGEETEQTATAAAVVEEEVVMGTTRRGRQIKMPSKLKGHEVTTASTTTAKRSPSEASDAPSESISSHSTAAIPTSSTTSKVTKKKVEERQIKEETPDAEPRSAMDAPPRRGGRRRY